MTTTIFIFLYLVVIALMCVGIFITILGLPGVWLMIGSVAAFAFITRSRGYVSNTALVWLLGLALLAEGVEFLASSAGTKSAGGSKRAMVGAVVGGLLGGIFLTFIPIPIVSTIVGVCLGCFIGAAVVELAIFDDVKRSLRVGAGAAKGRLMGLFAKLAVATVIFIVGAFAALPVSRKPRVLPPAVLPPTFPTNVATTTASTTPAPP